MTLDHADLNTESFSNSRGWTTVRVTHIPSSIAAERSRSRELQSAVQAQKECIDEIERLLAEGGPVQPPGNESSAALGGAVSRAEFEVLVARVEALEAQPRDRQRRRTPSGEHRDSQS